MAGCPISYNEMTMGSVVEKLIQGGVIHSPLVIRAFRTVPRRGFLPDDWSGSADVDAPIPIGSGQTNSQPYTVAIMLELLDIRPGQRILDVGAGSGWTAALLASMVGRKGRVRALERITALWERSVERVKPFHFAQLSILHTDGTAGWPSEAPYDRIHVAAAAARIPQPLLDQLAAPGKLIMPVGNPAPGFPQDLVLVEKQPDGTIRESRTPGFAFVPIVAGEVSKRYTEHP